MAREIQKILEEAQQPVPPELRNYAMTGGGGGGGASAGPDWVLWCSGLQRIRNQYTLTDKFPSSSPQASAAGGVVVVAVAGGSGAAVGRQGPTWRPWVVEGDIRAMEAGRTVAALTAVAIEGPLLLGNRMVFQTAFVLCRLDFTPRMARKKKEGGERENYGTDAGISATASGSGSR